ncbi:CRISPR-associated endonuclease Cas3'', partial [bacterium]|nr:CRISPR-associated endonuclease Cas3'' [bacterium]
MAWYAHTAENSDGARNPDRLKWQLLADHLQQVASFSENLAPARMNEAAYWAGLLHDFGKYRVEFQDYMAGEREGSVETHHAVYGAALAFKRNWLGPAFAVAGHHAGLHDLNQLQELVRGKKYDAMNQLDPLVERFEAELKSIPNELAEPAFVKCEDKAIAEFYVRMLFSCLVDADFLDTELFVKGGVRSPELFNADVLMQRLHRHCNGFESKGELNALRKRVFELCLSTAAERPGFFSLTVPTGGGKTLSGMAFALEHARLHGLRRVIVVIPYLSIIEQNAAEYRRVLDPEKKGIVIEHHSAVVGRDDSGEQGRSPEEMAAENWDAPIIVTTSVQFIESLFANRASKCRKLHNLANSVVVLDEVQALPVHLLNPLLHVLRDLREHYGVSFVFSTATQPAFIRTGSLPKGFEEGEVREIVTDTGELFHKLNRVKYVIRKTASDWVGLTDEWRGELQALGVVNTRCQAHDWWSQLRSDDLEGVLHLSSALCADHRAVVLAEAHRRLRAGEPCRLVATQVIEAG